MLKIFCVFDSVAGAYLQPFFMQSKGEALRGWIDVVNDPKTSFNKHPADYTLFELGEYDSLTGSIVTHEVKISLGTALEHQRKNAVTSMDQVVMPSLVTN